MHSKIQFQKKHQFPTLKPSARIPCYIVKQSHYKILPHYKIIMPNAIDRTVDGKVSLTIKELNNHFSSLEVNIADNSNIGKECLRREDLHLIERGSGKLLINFINKMKSL